MTRLNELSSQSGTRLKRKLVQLFYVVLSLVMSIFLVSGIADTQNVRTRRQEIDELFRSMNCTVKKSKFGASVLVTELHSTCQRSIPVIGKRSTVKFMESETSYDKTGTCLIRTQVSTEKENRVAEQFYSPTRPLLRCYQCKKAYKTDVCTFRGRILCSKEKFRK